MRQLEEVLKQKIKQSILTSDRETFVSLANYLLDTLWAIPSERNRLIDSIVFEGLAIKPTETKKKGRKKKIREVSEPEKKVPKKSEEIALEEEEHEIGQDITEADIVSQIEDEVKDMPDEEIEVADTGEENEPDKQEKPEKEFANEQIDKEKQAMLSK